MLFFLFYLIHSCYSYTIYTDQFHQFIQSPIKPPPIILESNNIYVKKKFINILSNHLNIEKIDISFNDFILNKLHLNNDNKLIYVYDFLLKNGRILNYYEFVFLKYLKKTNNLIIFNSDNMNEIKFKDYDIIDLYPIYSISSIKKEFIRYIEYIIEKYNYHKDIKSINWFKYDIDKLNFEKINILLYELNNLIKFPNELTNIEYDINELIKSLKRL
jgi:hypothetical protein